MADQPYFILAYCGSRILVDQRDHALLSARRWHLCGVGAHKYAYSTYYEGKKQKSVAMHRLIADAPYGMEVDHRNHDTLDNRRSNLRVCNRNENVANRHASRPSKTGFRGVMFLKGNFVARIVWQRRMFQISGFRTAFEAARAYDVLAMKHHGCFAITNFKYFEDPYGEQHEHPTVHASLDAGTLAYYGQRNGLRA